jgi:glycosyltransferase involved in cell wall biosynthesis
MTVTHFQRRPQAGQLSIERVFASVRASLPSEVNCRVVVSRFASRGVWRRLYNMIEAAFNQSDVNHVTGDVHFLSLLLHRRKTLLTILDCVSLERLKGVRRAIFRLLWYTLPISRSAVVSVISESTKTELLRYVRCPAEKIRVISPCISADFTAEPKAFNVSCPRILQVGTGANKNLARVAKALAGVSCELLVVGRMSSEQEKTLRGFRINYRSLGELGDEEMIRAYRSCDMLVFASTYEGFGLPILEANTVGRPVVTSDVLSMPEVAGDAACLVDPFDPESIRSGVLRVINDANYRELLIQEGYANAKRFSACAIAQQYAELYRVLAA